MQPVSRSDLQNAPQTAMKKKSDAFIREQQLRGQLMAEAFYKEVLEAATSGKTHHKSTTVPAGLAFDSMLSWIKEHFPDCTVTVQSLTAVSPSRHCISVEWNPV